MLQLFNVSFTHLDVAWPPKGPRCKGWEKYYQTALMKYLYMTRLIQFKLILSMEDKTIEILNSIFSSKNAFSWLHHHLFNYIDD